VIRTLAIRANTTLGRNRIENDLASNQILLVLDRFDNTDSAVGCLLARSRIVTYLSTDRANTPTTIGSQLGNLGRLGSDPVVSGFFGASASIVTLLSTEPTSVETHLFLPQPISDTV